MFICSVGLKGPGEVQLKIDGGLQRWTGFIHHPHLWRLLVVSVWRATEMNCLKLMPFVLLSTYNFLQPHYPLQDRRGGRGKTTATRPTTVIFIHLNRFLSSDRRPRTRWPRTRGEDAGLEMRRLAKSNEKDTLSARPRKIQPLCAAQKKKKKRLNLDLGLWPCLTKSFQRRPSLHSELLWTTAASLRPGVKVQTWSPAGLWMLVALWKQHFSIK